MVWYGWDPLAEFESARRWFDRTLGNLNLERRSFRPSASAALNVWEDGEAIYAEAELPGVRPEHLEVLVDGTDLTVKGSRESLEHESAANHRSERPTADFSRTVRMPCEVDASNVTAKLENGVLSLTLPKVEASKARKIEVKT